MYYFTSIVIAVAAIALTTHAAPRAEDVKTPKIKFHQISREQYDHILALTKQKDEESVGRLISGFGSFSEGITTITKPISSSWSSLLRITGFNSHNNNDNGEKVGEDTVPLCAIRTSNLIDEETKHRYREDVVRQLSSPHFPPVVYRDEYGRPTYQGAPHDLEEDFDAAKRPVINCVVVVKRRLTEHENAPVPPFHPRPPNHKYPKPYPMPYPYPYPVYDEDENEDYAHGDSHDYYHGYGHDYQYGYGNGPHYHQKRPPAPAPARRPSGFPPARPPASGNIGKSPPRAPSTTNALPVSISNIPQIPGYYIEIQPPAAESAPVVEASPAVESVSTPAPETAPALVSVSAAEETPMESVAVAAENQAETAGTIEAIDPQEIPIIPLETIVPVVPVVPVAPIDVETSQTEDTESLAATESDDDNQEAPAEIGTRIGDADEPIAYPLLPQSAIFNGLPGQSGLVPNGLFYYPPNPFDQFGLRPPMGVRRRPIAQRRKPSKKRRNRPNRPAQATGTPVISGRVADERRTIGRQNYDYDQQLAAYYGQQPNFGIGYNTYAQYNPFSQPYEFNNPYAAYPGYGYDNFQSFSGNRDDSDEDYDSSNESAQVLNGPDFSGEDTSDEQFGPQSAQQFGSQNSSEEYK